MESKTVDNEASGSVNPAVDQVNEEVGEIYLIRNKENGKCYVGQAMKEVGVLKAKWGTQGRWKSHLREAKNTIDKGQKDHCVLLNHAIRKYGENGFEVTTISKCYSQAEMDEKEVENIKNYKALVPDGYNLTTGGSKGKDSDETREKKRQMRLGKKHKEETKQNISTGQIGNRRDVKPRKYPEDASLPKYIQAKRTNSVIVGYSVSSFPIGVEEKKYVSKSFSNKANPEIALQQAKDYLAELQEQYKDISTQIAEKQEEQTPEEKPALNITRSARKDKQGSDKYDMPKYVSLKLAKGKEIVFAVEGLRLIKDDGTIIKYCKSFNHNSKTMQEKLEMAIAHLAEMRLTHNCLE